MLFPVVILGISLSLDAFGAGISYGLRGIRIPLLPKLVICAFSIVYSLIAIVAGKAFSSIIPIGAAKLAGIIILILMGAWIILQSFTAKENSNAPASTLKKSDETLFRFVIKSLGITVQVIKNPIEGDIDKSGIIDLPEAVLLGLALSVDAIGVGIGSALTGFHSMSIPFAIGLFQLIFLYAGTFAGSKFKVKESANKRIIAVLPGVLLILLAIIRIR